MNRLITLAFLCALFLGTAEPAHSQAIVVTTCGTLPSSIGGTRTAGSRSDTFIDVNGQLCTNATGGTGGTSSTFDGAFPATGTAAGLSDGTNMKAWLTALALADGVNGNNTGAVAGWLYNGTTWDRARGDTTSGAWVNVKASVLPTGAATAANQATANTALSDIKTAVQGDVPSVTGPLNAATAAATKMLVTGCQYLSSLPTYTNTQQGSCTFDVNGRLLVTTLSSSVGAGATGSAPPANAVYLGANGSGATGGLLKGLIQCDSFVPLANLATATTVELVALTSGRTIYVCGFHVMASGTTTVTLKYGTGSNCGTGTTVITDGYDLTAQTGLVDRAAFWQGMKTASANALCVTNSAAVKITGGVYYTVQ